MGPFALVVDAPVPGAPAGKVVAMHLAKRGSNLEGLVTCVCVV